MNDPRNIPELAADPHSEENLQDPYPMHERMREAGPVVRLPLFGSLLACARHAETHAVFNDHARFILGAGGGMTNVNVETPFRPKSLILEVDPPLHTQHRAVLSRILSPNVVLQIRAAFSAEAEALIDRCVESSPVLGPIDGSQDLAQPYPLKVFSDAVGLDDGGRENLLLNGDMISSTRWDRATNCLRRARPASPRSRDGSWPAAGATSSGRPASEPLRHPAATEWPHGTGLGYRRVRRPSRGTN